MIALVFEFDGVSAATLDLFEQLPQALEGRSVLVDYRPVAPPSGVAPWMRLLGGDPAPGRWPCEQVLRRGPVEPMEALAAALGLPPDGHALPAASGPVPAIVWDGRRFDGDLAIERFIAALPSA
ncbi:MAG: hypothetical protein ABW067_03820 [Rhizobacter sp.]